MRWSRRIFLSLAALIASGCSKLVPSSSKQRGPSSWFWDTIFGRRNSTGDSIAKYPEKLEDEYDVVIIGSGYGASVMAARISEERKDLKVCVLERGKEYKPGDLPEKLTDLTVKGKLDPAGLLEHNVSVSSDLDIVCASGLGGTSLINAAISIRPEPLVFTQKEWPHEIRSMIEQGQNESLGELERYFQKAENALEANPNERNLSLLPKSKRIQTYFKKENITHGFLNLAIKYQDENSYGIDRKACTYCGNCCSGCNVGAKNILPYNYLSHAKKNGCNLFIQSEVKKIKPISEGEYRYEIQVDKYRDRLPLGKKKIKAKYVFLGAGSMGSTNILLKSKNKKFKFSEKLGDQLSLNGDVLGFCYNGKTKTNSAGFGTNIRRKIFNGDVGPAITTYGNYRFHPKQDTIQDRFLLLEGSIPGPLANVTAYGLAVYAKNNKKEMNFSKEQWARVEKDFKTGPLNKPLDPQSALNHSTLFLACGHDSAKGKYRLNVLGDISVKWDGVAGERYFSAITEEMKKASKQFGGFYLDNPRTSIFKGKMMATHPLGGCPMGENEKSGVVDHKGRVFNENGDVHQGLYVVDAAIIPRSLGATPLLTITALAERIAEKFLDEIK